MSRSEAIRLALERTCYLHSQMKGVIDLVLQYHEILTPALEEFRCDNFRAVARALPAIVGSYIQENDLRADGYVSSDVDPNDLHRKLETMHPIERIYLLDCIVARREWPQSHE